MRAGEIVADRFLLERFVDSGGMGNVHRALDRATGRPVALKSLLVRDPAGIERLEREAAALETLRHPGVVSYVAHGRTADGTPYLAMEWLEGENLATRLERAGLSAREVVALGKQLADALHAAHECGVVHRDVKPANVFLLDGAVDRAKVLDFGIARHKGAMRPLTGTGMVIGTLGYMAPEQVRGDVEIDDRVDVFALGCVLFECLAGRRAYGAERGLAVLASILLEEPPLLSEVSPHVPPELSAIVARAMSKARASRPSMAELSAALSGISPLDARPPVIGALPSPAITSSEQRFASVILIAPEAETSMATAGTVAAEESSSAAPTVTKLVQHHGGQVAQLADGTLAACFTAIGLPTDQAARAARCASALHQQMPTRPVVLATGRSVLLGRVPLGEALDRGAHLLEERHVEGVRIDSVTMALLSGRFELRERDAGAVLLGERSELPARTLLGRATPCVGRERELRTLETLAESCFARAGATAVLVTGAPGIGKSRIARELCARLVTRAPGLELWRADADLIAGGSPLAMMAALLRRAAGATEGETREVRRAKLEARAARRLPRPRAQWAAAFLGELIDAPADASALDPPLRAQLEAARADPRRTSRETQRAFFCLLEADCNSGPVLLVLEDLHWCDRATIERIDAALEALSDAPLMVLALARPEVAAVYPDLWQHRGVQELRLRELPARAAGELVRAVLGSDLPDATVSTLVERAGGNAFFLEELIRSAAEVGARPVDVQALPDTVLAMLEARLLALGDGARRSLRAASIFGDVFWRGGVRALLGATEAGAVDDTLEELVRREVIARSAGSRYAGEDELTFRHALVREAAYGTLTDDDRRLGHKLAAAWLQSRGETDPQPLAEHLERGAESAAEHLLAAAAWARAGQRASDRCAQADAIRHYDRALSLLGASGLQAAPTDVATRPGRSLPTASIELAAQLGGGSSRAVIRGSEVSAVEDDFQRALELAHATGDGTPLFRTLIGLYSFAALRSRFATARELGERCMRIAKSTGDAALEFEACRPLYSVAIFVGEMAEARRHIERAKALLDRVANRPQPVMLSMYTEVALWFFEALSCALGGDVDRAIEVMQRATAFAEQRRHAFSDAFAAYGEALLARTRGEPRLSLEAAERCFAAADEFDFNWLRHLALGYRGWAEARLGKPASGIARLRAAVDGLTASGETMTMTDLQCALAECCIADGRFDEARLVVEAIAKLAAESGGVVFEPERLRLRAVLELSQHGAAAEPEAVDLLQRAIVVAERQEAPFLALRAARVLAQVLARTDRLREARELLDRAIGGVRTSASVADIREAVKERAALGS